MFVKNELNYQNIMARKIKFFYSEFSASSRSWTQFEFSILRTNGVGKQSTKDNKRKGLKNSKQTQVEAKSSQF